MYDHLGGAANIEAFCQPLSKERKREIEILSLWIQVLSLGLVTGGRSRGGKPVGE